MHKYEYESVMDHHDKDHHDKDHHDKDHQHKDCIN